MSPIPAILFLLLSAVAAIAAKPTTYEVLAGYNFPSGILPQGVTGYELDESSGKFRAFLNGSCSFSLEGSYQLSYKSTISGVISKNKLTGLNGVTVKILFFWLNIVEVIRDGDDLEFSVGIASASFPLDNFFVSPQCGCGLDCRGDGDEFRVRKLIEESSGFVIVEMRGPFFCRMTRASLFSCLKTWGLKQLNSNLGLTLVLNNRRRGL